ncbi:MAG: lysylphosphatidylglycerol synthase transmembrane domain-containing protein, partial [Gemmatimonadales bacterium]
MTPPERRSARALQIGLGIAVSGVLVWLAFRHEPFADVWAIIRTAHAATMCVAVALSTVPFVLRVPRWRLLLRHHHGGAIAVPPLWNAIAIGFAANNLLPLRAGELLRVAAISRLAPVSFAAALSSVAIERVLDALVVVTLLGVGLVGGQLPLNSGMTAKAEWIGVLCLVAMLLAIGAAWRRDAAMRRFERLLPSGPASAKLVAFVDNVLRGLGAMRDPRRAAPVILWSVVIWLVNASAFFVAFRAFGFAVPFSGALVLQGAVMIGIAVPSTPGYVGVLDTAIYGTLLLYGVDQPHG